MDSITNRKVAIKILSKRKLKKLPAGESAVKKEVDVLSKLRHVNIVEHIDYFTLEEKGKMYLMLFSSSQHSTRSSSYVHIL